MPSPAIEGFIRYRKSELAVPDVTLRLFGDRVLQGSSAEDGSYGWNPLPGGSWSVLPVSADGMESAVTALDAADALVLVTSPDDFDIADRLSADTSGNGSASAYDAALLLQFVVGSIDSLPVGDICNSHWFFTPAAQPHPGQILSQPVIAPNICTSGGIGFAPLVGRASGQDFVAGIFGDVNASWSPAGTAAADEFAPGAPQLRLGHVRRRGSQVRIPITLESDAPVRALQFTLRYDPAQLGHVRVRRDPAVRGALSATRTSVPGEVRVALASRTPLTAGPIGVIAFRSLERSRSFDFELLDSRVE